MYCVSSFFGLNLHVIVSFVLQNDVFCLIAQSIYYL